MATVKGIYYERLFSFGHFQNVRFGIEMQVDEGEDVQKVFRQARATVKRAQADAAIAEIAAAKRKKALFPAAPPEESPDEESLVVTYVDGELEPVAALTGAGK